MKKESAIVRDMGLATVYIEIANEGASIRSAHGRATQAIKKYCTAQYQNGIETIHRIEQHGYAGYSQRVSDGKKFYSFYYKLA